ncbi:hypothetical protein B566_EDAN002743 [Ephemera danica]|nr:hypothetical protein B566_EDAN002743 [Ephemera danica]
MHQPSNAADQGSSTCGSSGSVTGAPAAGTAVSGYSQKNYHIDGNLYSVLTPSAAAASSSTTSEKASKASKPRATELPYMGEITLDSKPRRGRKPKKADICHLIYKNYGTVFPSPKKLPEAPISTTVANNKPKIINWAKDGQEKNNPLLHNNLAWNKPSGSLLEKRLTGGVVSMNLAEALKRAAAAAAPPKQLKTTVLPDVGSLNVPSRDPSLAQACVQRLLAYAAGLDEQNEPLNLCMRDRLKVEPSSGSDSELEQPPSKLPPGVAPIEASQPGGYVFWPSAGVFVHPQLLYKPPSPTVPPVLASSPRSVKKKRKRSAIFIPPAESPTEVSICKFKFTGGAKPSLEEKKMLSVDAGGNFRFYSGTDKGMRSFLPHLQHPPPSIIAASPTSSPAPLHKVNLPPSEDSFQLQSSPSPASSSVALDHPSMHLAPPSPQDRLSNSKRKRRSRKSEVREKLEQTFKEKGFLIQTQQLESAEGATYCKFRQLRKFTRYLFRSWRDYLPHSIQDLTQANQQQQQQQECSSSNLGEAPPVVHLSASPS